jgi:excisionase family DNA binding protein
MATTQSTLPSGLVLDVQPLVDAVRRHVPLSAAKEKQLRQAFEQVLGAQLLRPAAKPDPAARSKTKKESEDMVLTTQQAANLVKVSRPYLTARIDAGEIPLHQKVGNQRRVLKSDLLAWHRREQRKVASARQELADMLSDELQTYDL